MTKSESILLDTIKKSLFNIEAQYPADANWDEVLKEAAAQSVVGLAIDGAPKEVQRQWQLNLYQTIANFTQNLYAQTGLLKLLSNNGIRTAILKGSSASVYYPVPGLRSLGDIDFYVMPEQLEMARHVLESEGFIYDGQEDSRHVKYYKDGITYEMHYHFSYDDLDIEKYIEVGTKNAEVRRVDSHFFPMLPPLANGLVLLAHLRYHLKSGLGLRQVIDWMMYCDKVLDDDFWRQEFCDACGKTGMDTLAITVTRMCQIYLGMKEDISWCREANEETCHKLMSSLLSSGNFGVKNTGGVKFEAVSTYFRNEGVFHYLQRSGESVWKAYHKHHWLKPFCWAYQICRYVRLGIRSGRGKKILSDVDRSADRAELLKLLKI